MAMEEEEDEEEEVQKLLSCSVDPAQFSGRASSPTQPRFSHNERDLPHHADGLKLYQIRAQNLLHNYLDKTMATTLSDSDEVIVSANWCTKTDEVMSPIRLFKHAPSGILLTSDVKPVPRKVIHSCSSSSDEDSIESLARLEAVVVDGETVKLEAIRAAERALRAAEKDLKAAEIASKKEEERVRVLKEQRGEAWLPSLTNKMTTWKNF